MKHAKRKKLEAKGWKVGTAADFLGLSPEEEAFIEMKLSLSKSLREMRRRKHLSQIEFAKLIKSSQSRVAKMEAGEASVSIDLLIKSLLALGASQKDLAKVISTK
ncbi:MAG: helix-turn-helix transcriptional regulator [Gammaproteobacteria bacterium]|nr:helix-turn-helix transcriptional regulator [Gammaproteobacteria bacterium]MDH5594523.1 helix-turn-helix transcriptional regulator [Gammaproteobacteria bacterium]MDH5614351.1 helix-turn-helix transcriptional regulator [Gammaproteobacteria bacterium]